MTSFQDKLDALPEFPKSYLDGDYESEPTAVRHAFRARLALARALIVQSKRRHYYCEDSWYSCPKAEDGCADDRRGPECDCGVAEWNATVDLFTAKLDSEGL